MITFEGFGGIKLAADEFGSPDQPAVLLLPGGGQTRRSWRAAAQALAAAGRYALTLDLRGHGDSEWSPDGRYDLEVFANDVRAVLNQLPTRPVLVGTSIGGYAALAALAQGGEALATGLVLSDAAPWVSSNAQGRFGDLMQRHAKGFATIEDAADAAQDFSPDRPRPKPESLQLRKGEDGRFYWRWDPRVFTGGFNMDDVSELESVAAGLTLPTLVLRGRESELVTESEMERFRKILPTAEFLDIEGAGHLASLDKSDAFNSLLLEFLERRVPRESITYEAGSDPRTLRDALGCFGTGVVVATTMDSEGQPRGLTVNSFTSVSLDPPLILFCLAKNAGTVDAFKASETFAVNVLHIGQQPTSGVFASRVEDRFAETDWEQWQTGAPIIKDSLASFECNKHAWHDGGDHYIVIGKVLQARFEPRRDPLLYHHGKYRRIHLM